MPEPLTARLGRALLAFSGGAAAAVGEPGPAPPAPAAIGAEIERLKAAYATPALDILPSGTVTGGSARFTSRPTDDAMLRWYGENPWAHNRFLMLCTGVADAPFRVGTLAGEQFTPLPRDYPFWQLLEEPNEFLDGWDFRFLSTLYLRATGEVYWRVRRGGLLGTPSELWVLPRTWVQAVRDRATNRVVYYNLRLPGRLPGPPERVDPRDMVWIRSPDPADPYLRGLGDMLSASTEIEAFEYASEYDRRLMLNDARPSFWMEVPGAPQEPERRAMRDDFQLKYGGFWNAGGFPLLWGGATLHQFQQTKKEMDYTESQRMLRDTIVAPLHKVMVGITEDVNRAQAETAESIFGRWHILPAANRIARGYTKVARLFDPRAVVQVRREDIVPEDKAANVAKVGATATIAEVDERRGMVGLPPMPNGAGKVRQLPVAIIEVPTAEGPAPEPAPAPPRPGPGGQPAREDEDQDAEGDGDRPRRRPPKPPRPYGGRLAGGVLTAEDITAQAVAKARRPSLAEIMRALPPEGSLARTLLARLLGAYEAVMAARWESAAAEVGIDAAFDVGHPEVARFLREEAGARIRGIDATTLDAVRAQLAEGTQAGESVAELARRVSDVFDAAKGNRAFVIARTETLYASNRAAFIAYGESGVVPKLEWLLAPDYTPEIDGGECEPFDGKVVEYGQEFAPGVPFPPLHPQCRCTVAPVFEGGRRLYAGERRKQHITALGRAHARLERVFLNALLRAIQEQQNAVLRAVRRAG